MPKIDVTEELWLKIDGLSKRLEISFEEIINDALDCYMIGHEGELGKKRNKPSFLPGTKYTPSK